MSKFVSCLETRSIAERHEQLARHTYTPQDPYHIGHKDALATGDQMGKGTGHAGHTFYLPDCTMGINDFTKSFAQFDTHPESGAGNCQDNQARNTAFGRMLYTHLQPYSYMNLDSSRNLAEGQYSVNRLVTRIKKC